MCFEHLVFPKSLIMLVEILKPCLIQLQARLQTLASTSGTRYCQSLAQGLQVRSVRNWNHIVCRRLEFALKWDCPLNEIIWVNYVRPLGPDNTYLFGPRLNCDLDDKGLELNCSWCGWLHAVRLWARKVNVNTWRSIRIFSMSTLFSDCFVHSVKT